MAGHAKPGAVLVGVCDDGACANLLIDDELLKRLAGLRDEGKILPFSVMTVERRTLRGCAVAAVIVAPSDNPPVKVNGRVWVRVGPTCRAATAAEEHRLLEKRRWGDLPPDAQPVHGADREELDLRRFQIEYVPSAVAADVIAENERPLEDQLKA